MSLIGANVRSRKRMAMRVQGRGVRPPYALETGRRGQVGGVAKRLEVLDNPDVFAGPLRPLPVVPSAPDRSQSAEGGFARTK